MPGSRIEGKKVIISDDKHKDIYWVELSDTIKFIFYKFISCNKYI